MPKYGGVKYHRLFSKKFVKYMQDNYGFEIKPDGDEKILHKDYENGIEDFINSHPTVAGPGKIGEYTMQIAGGYYRIFHDIEDLNKEILRNWPHTNNFFVTIIAVAASGKVKLVQSDDAVKELFRLWKEEMYPKVLLDLQVFDDINNLNILFNYPEESTKRGYPELVNIENSGPRGKIRSLLIAKEAQDKNFEKFLEMHIKEYEKYEDGTKETRDQIAMIISMLKKVGTI